MRKYPRAAATPVIALPAKTASAIFQKLRGCRAAAFWSSVVPSRSRPVIDREFMACASQRVTELTQNPARNLENTQAEVTFGMYAEVRARSAARRDAPVSC